MQEASGVSAESPLLIDHFVDDATEVIFMMLSNLVSLGFNSKILDS
jgi:hypothetical protein